MNYNLRDTFNKLIIKEQEFIRLYNTYNTATGNTIKFERVSNATLFDKLQDISSRMSNAINTDLDNSKDAIKEDVKKIIIEGQKSLLRYQIYNFFVYSNDVEKNKANAAIYNILNTIKNFYTNINEENPYFDENNNINFDSLTVNDGNNIKKRIEDIDNILNLTLSDSDRRVREILMNHGLI